MRIVKTIGKVVFGLLLLAGIGIAVIAYTNVMVYQFSDTEPAEYTAKAAAEPTVAPDTLLVMTYNIKFGGGRIDFWFDCHGDRVIMDSAEVVGNMDRMLALIDSIHPHILLIQEADWHSKRAAFINQVQYILDHTYFTAATYASQWNAFVPSNGLGRVNSGNAVLSVLRTGRLLGTRCPVWQAKTCSRASSTCAVAYWRCQSCWAITTRFGC